jgi:hypothetical protein
VALVYPVETISVDGDLSDWPSYLPSYSITQPESGAPPKDSSDFSARLRFAYSARQNALYAAVEVEDESIVIDDTPTRSWDSEDGIEIYLDLWMASIGGGVIRYDGESFTSLTTADGLPNDTAHSLVQDGKGDIWVSTWDSGVSRYDGTRTCASPLPLRSDRPVVGADAGRASRTKFSVLSNRPKGRVILNLAAPAWGWPLAKSWSR